MVSFESTPKEGVVTDEECRLASRNHGFLLEALRYPTTPVGMHYLLVHYDVPIVDEDSWNLEIDGLVRHSCRLSLDDLRRLPTITQRVTLECAGNGRMKLSPRALSVPWNVEAVGTGEWTGTPLRCVLEEAGISEDAIEAVFTGLDSGIENDISQHYERSLPMSEALRDEVMLAYELNGQPLPPQHGFPLRLVVPGWYGMTSVKWISHIRLIDHVYDGYQNAYAYRMRTDPDEPGVALNRIRPRSLMVPPGVPEFFTRDRTVTPGRVMLEGRAWSGFAPISRVEVSTDGGSTWAEASLGTQTDRYGWVGWTYKWDAAPGVYDLACRASDTDGNTQPAESEWNLGGYACNTVHSTKVTVG